jgi:DNA topoisomerase-1
MNLFIVESPNKCSKIKSFLGTDYTVVASVGHITEIPKKGMNIDVGKSFEPHCEIISSKKDVVKNIKDLATKAELIFLASDPDREGSKISMDLYNLFSEKDKKKCWRISFDEITKKAIENAISNKRKITDDQQLIDAQKARQVLDRLIGYSASPLLFRSFGSNGKKGLSAGRVQSSAL